MSTAACLLCTLLHCLSVIKRCSKGLLPQVFHPRHKSLFASLTDTEGSRMAPNPDKGSSEQVDRDVLLSSVFKSKHRASL